MTARSIADQINTARSRLSDAAVDFAAVRKWLLATMAGARHAVRHAGADASALVEVQDSLLDLAVAIERVETSVDSADRVLGGPGFYCEDDRFEEAELTPTDNYPSAGKPISLARIDRTGSRKPRQKRARRVA